jgi:hypothetical protein
VALATCLEPSAPPVETLEGHARAMEVPLYQIFYDSETTEPKELKLSKSAAAKLSGKDVMMISRLSQLVSRMDKRNERLLVGLAQKLAAQK